MAQETILIVEDETITALDIQQSLRRSGYQVPGIACTADEAIGLARQNRPDLALMDIRLKGEIDGIQTALLLRQEFNTPIVFLTAYADRTTLQRAKAAEPFAYLLKPFEEAVLATTIEIALHKQQAHELLRQQSADALQLSDARFQSLVENMQDYAVVLLDPAGQIVSWSPGAERLHGWCAGEALGHHFSMLYPPEEVGRQKPEQDLETAARSSRHVLNGFQCRKDHTRFSAEVVLVCLRDRAASPAGFLRITRAMTVGSE